MAYDLEKDYREVKDKLTDLDRKMKWQAGALARWGKLANYIRDGKYDVIQPTNTKVLINETLSQIEIPYGVFDMRDLVKMLEQYRSLTARKEGLESEILMRGMDHLLDDPPGLVIRFGDPVEPSA